MNFVNAVMLLAELAIKYFLAYGTDTVQLPSTINKMGPESFRNSVSSKHLLSVRLITHLLSVVRFIRCFREQHLD